MSVAERLKEDLTSSLKGKRAERAGVLRMLIAEIHNKEKEKPAGGQILSDDEATAVLRKEAKKRREAMELFRKGGREDLVKKDEAELAVIGEYLPRALSAAEIDQTLRRLFEKGPADFNSLMREAMKELGGRADGKLVSELVRKLIADKQAGA